MTKGYPSPSLSEILNKFHFLTRATGLDSILLHIGSVSSLLFRMSTPHTSLQASLWLSSQPLLLCPRGFLGPSGIGEGGRVFGPACGPADMSLKGQRKGRGSGRRDLAGGRASEPGVVLEVRVGGTPQGRSVLGRRGAAGAGAVERALRASQVCGAGAPRRCAGAGAAVPARGPSSPPP